MPHINDVPIEEFASLKTADQINKKCEELKLTRCQSWFMPQLVHYFSTWQIHDNQNRLLTLPEICRLNLTTQRAQGAWILACRAKRSVLVKTQHEANSRVYGALTPLILMSWRQYLGVGYNQWRNQPIELVVEPELAVAMQLPAPEITVPELLQLRQLGLTQTTGTAAGTQKNPATTWRLTNMKNTRLETVPRLQQCYLTQIWLAHPTQRLPYMILAQDDWERMPEPLVTADVFHTVPKLQKSTEFTTPWQL